MKVLIINAGSSSIKYQLLAMPSKEMLCQGIVERVGAKDAILKYKTVTADVEVVEEIASHKVGLNKVVEYLLDPKIGVILNVDEIEVIGHRVVHGGNAFSNTTIITEQVKNKIKELFSLAPLHNPHNLEGIILTEQLFPKAKQVAVFDTAFHQTVPEKAKKYAIPQTFYDQGIQLYGFHGISHKYVSEKAIEYIGNNDSKIITVHLGNGCSMTAVKNGESFDHSMGFGPINGLIMGTRSGDIDHAIIFYLVNNLGYILDEVNTLLIKESGMLSLTGYSDLREIEALAAEGNRECQLALDMNAYRIKKYIGSFIAAMGGLDAIVFTAGIGENSSTLRNLVCKDMEYLGITLDADKNQIRSKEIREINQKDAKVKVLVIPTNEEIEIAKEAYGLA